MAIEISSTDVSEAEAFLATLLEENIEDGRFTEGTALRDLAVKGLAFIHAYMQKENETVRTLQSLRNITNLGTSTDPNLDRAVSSAVDALLSNWFITRKTGTFARGVLYVRVSRRQDYVIPSTTRFLYTRDLSFFLDSDTATDIIVPASDLQANITGTGEVESYTLTLRVKASRTGGEYNVAPSEWDSAGGFSPFIVGAANTATFSGGDTKETTDALITRANSAIAERSLISERTLTATLTQNFAELSRLYVAGFGDPEMLRDLITEFATELNTHVGGHYDVYVELPVAERVYEGVLGGSFARPDNIANIFRDATVTDWTATNVQVGDIIRVSDGLAEAPKDFVVREILAAELRISEIRPFSEATDETSANVSYYIYRPLFGADTQILPVTGTNTTGVTSRSVSNSGRILLPGNPVYDIIDVAVIDPDPSDPAINGADGFVHFPVRQNTTPFLTLEPSGLNFQVISSVVGTSQSADQFMELLLPAFYDGKTVRVTYEALSGYESVDTYLKDRFERILASNPLAKGFHPVYLNVNVQYKTLVNPTGTVDEAGLRDAIVEYINSFSPNEVIDTSDVIAAIRSFDTNIGAVLPLTITYDLISPDGNIIQFTTADTVSVSSDKVIAEDAALLSNPLELGLTDNVIRYRTTFDRITVEQV